MISWTINKSFTHTVTESRSCSVTKSRSSRTTKSEIQDYKKLMRNRDKDLTFDTDLVTMNYFVRNIHKETRPRVIVLL